MELFKDEIIKETIDTISSYIKGSFFEGRVYAVGDCVRNALLGEPSNKIELVVNYQSGGMMLGNFLAMKDLSYKLGINPIMKTDTDNTTVVHLHKPEKCADVEIRCYATKKEEFYFVGCKPYFSFGTLQEDAKRRDLTVNSLYYSLTEQKIYDYNGTGLYDIYHKILRTPSDPDKIISQDPLRILRIIKYACENDWGICKETWFAMIKNANKITNVPYERINNEISEILCSPNPSVGIRKMAFCGVLQKIMPDIYDMQYGYECKNPEVTTFDHTMEVLDAVEPYIEHRLAALFHDVGRIVTDKDRTLSPNQFSAEVAEADLKQLKFPKQIIYSVSTAIRHHEWFSTYTDGFTPPDKRIRKFLNSCGDEIGVTLDLMHANNTHKAINKKKTQVLGILKRIEELDEIDKAAKVTLPINGNDIKEYFSIKPSPIIGIALEKVKDAYFENPDITKDQALSVVEAFLKESY